MVYFLLVFSICKMLFISSLYLNCCKIFEVLFNPRMIIIIIIIIAIICTVSLVPPTLRVWQFFVEVFLACTVHQTYIFRFAVLVTKYLTQEFSFTKWWILSVIKYFLDTEILQLQAKFQTGVVSCSRFIWIKVQCSDHGRAGTANLLHA